MANEQVKPDQTGEGNEPGKEPKYLTSEEVNRAITSRMKAFEKKLDETIPNISSALKDELIALIAEKNQSKQSSQQSQTTVQDTPELAGLRKQMKGLEDQARQLKEERDLERANARDTQLRQTLSEELSKYGVDSKHLHHAVGFLADAEKRVRWNEEGNGLVFKDTDGQDIDLKTGIRSWVQTDDGKLYLPPRGTSGTGGRPARGTSSGSKKDSEAYTSAEVADALWKTLME